MKIKRNILLLTAILIGQVAGSRLMAQTGTIDSRIEMIRIELVRTERLIQQVSEAIHSTDNPIAAVTLSKAVEIQQKARAAFQQKTEVGFKTALTLTMKARELAKAALANVRQTDQFEGIVARKLERAQELLAKAGEIVSLSRSPELKALFEAARTNLQRGWEFFRNHRFRPAVKLADQVEKTAERIIQLVGDGGAGRLQFERRWETVRQSLEEIGHELDGCESPLAAKIGEQIEVSLKQAREMADAGHWQNGLRLLQQARTLANRAIQECEGDRQLRLKHGQLEEEASRLSEVIQELDGTKREAAMKLLEQARDQLRMAVEFYEEQKFEAARAALKGAQLALRRIQRLLGASR